MTAEKKPLYANVSFKVGGKQAYTYRIPPEMTDQLCPGVRVKAPFRKQEKIGFVVDVTDYCPIEEAKVLDLQEVLDRESRFSPHMMGLIEWASHYYHATIGSVMRAAYPFPSFLSPRQRQAFFLAHSPEETLGWIQQNEKRSPKRAAILRVLLKQREPMLRDKLLKISQAGEGSLTRLREMGSIQETTVEVPRLPQSYHGQFIYKRPEKLTEEQRVALSQMTEAVQKNESPVFLLQGVTGSGKTEVYLKAIEETLKIGKTALALVPEISLTPQTADRFRSRFGEHVGILHSALGEGERYDGWRLAREGKLSVIVGTRSAIFCPLPNLGLIVVDEEHDHSYKQEDPAPRYHARDLAVVRGKIENCPVVLGSATPSLETKYNAIKGKYRQLILPKRVTGWDLPLVRVIDLRGRVHKEAIVSTELETAIRKHSEAGGQAILFLNRRGYATLVICRKCGHVFGCPNCTVGLVYHQQHKKLICHHCDATLPEPKKCPECHEPWVRFQGVGTEQVEELIKELFPNLRVSRMDLDTTRRKGAHGRILGAFRRGEIDILIGTQMISKGLDFPGVSLVGIISADVSLNLPDFRSGERTFCLITQVAGRAGRGEVHGEVIVQSFSPRHYSIQMAISQDYSHFFERELKFRKLISFPPLTRLTNIRTECEKEKAGETAAARLGGCLRKWVRQKPEIEQVLNIVGPLPAPLYRLNKVYRWHITLKSRRHDARQALLEIEEVRKLIDSPPSKVKFIVDTDPLSML